MRFLRFTWAPGPAWSRLCSVSFTASWSLPSLSGFWEPDPAVVTGTWGDQEVLESGSWKGEGSGTNVQALGFQGAVLVGQGRGEPGVAACWGKVPGERRTQAGSSWKLACSILNKAAEPWKAAQVPPDMWGPDRRSSTSYPVGLVALPPGLW